jgi:hypothetical protein
VKKSKLIISLGAAALIAACSGSGEEKKAEETKPAEEQPAEDKPAEAAPASDNKFAAEAAKNITEENAEAEADKLEKELTAELEG